MRKIRLGCDVYYVDSNLNTWSCQSVTEEEAIQGSASLCSCSLCRDCYNCSKCKSCYDCKHCSECQLCTSCDNCLECSRCFLCSGCSDCSMCDQCSKSHSCRTSTNLSDCVVVNYSLDCKSSKFCARCDSLKNVGKAYEIGFLMYRFEGVEYLTDIESPPDIYVRIGNYSVAWSQDENMRVNDTTTQAASSRTIRALKNKAVSREKRVVLSLVDALFVTLMRYKHLMWWRR